MIIPQLGRFVFVFLLFSSLMVSVTSASDKQMSLSDCIAVAVQENRTIKNAYLDRVSQKYSLRMAEETFIPTLELKPSISTTGNRAALGGGGSTSASNPTMIPKAEITIIERLPSNALVTLSGDQSLTSTQQAVPSRSYGWSINLTQPLLKNAGIDAGMEPVRAARIAEQNNILSLKSTVMTTLKQVVTSYRTYIQAIKSLEITRQSLERSRELVAINRELIAAGRMAAIEIIQSEADLANQEFNLLSTENDVDAARLALTKAIDIDKNSRINPVPETGIPPVPYNQEQATKLAFENRTDYAKSLLDLENTKRALVLAKRNTLWDLSLTGSYAERYDRSSTSAPVSSNGNWSGMLALTIPFDNLYRASIDRQNYIVADIALKKFENELAKQRENISIEVQDALRSAEMNYRQIRLASLARTLSEKKVEIETEKLKAGRSTNFQLVSYQNDLKNAQVSELKATINYQNALTNLDDVLGITLDRWGVALVERK